jgi:hypothetical protein
MKNGRASGIETWLAYRKETRQSAPAHLAEMVRARIARAPRILPRVATACLISSIALTAMVTFSLVATDSPLPDRPSDPPPVFGDGEEGLFPPTAFLESP